MLKGDQIGLRKRGVDARAEAGGDAVERLAELGQMLDEGATCPDTPHGRFPEHQAGIAPRDFRYIRRTEWLGVKHYHSRCHSLRPSHD